MWTIYRRLLSSSFKEYLRDPLPTLFAFVIPLFFIFTFGITARIVNTSGNTFMLKITVLGKSDVAEHAYAALRTQKAFMVSQAQTDDAEELLHSGKAQAVVRASVEDASALEIVTTQGFSGLASLVGQAIATQSLTAPTPKFSQRTIGDRRFDYFAFLFPSIVTLALLQVALFGTAAPIVNAKEKGMYRYYAVVPMPRLALLAAQISVRLLISLIQVALLMAVGCLLFGMRIHNPMQLLPVLILGALLLVTFGYAIAGLFRSVGVATAVLTLFNFYCMLFGQLFVDLSQTPWIKWMVLTTPVGFISDALRQIITDTPGMFALHLDIAGMFAWLLASVFIGLRYFQFQPKAQ